MGAMGTIKCDSTTSYDMIYYCPKEIDESGGSLLDIIRSHLPSLRNPFTRMTSPSLPAPHWNTISFSSLPADLFHRALGNSLVAGSMAPRTLRARVHHHDRLVHRAKGNDGLAWLIMVCSVAMVTSLIFLAVRKWRRHTYHQVGEA